MPTAPITPSPNLTVEAIVAVEAPREFRLHPRDRLVAFTAETAGARQLFTLALRGGYPSQLTASEKPVSDPQWSPDGRRLAFVRDDEIWVIEADGSRLTRVVGKPGAGREPRWSPDGHRLAFLSRRRGWSQIWLIDAPVPRRGRPATEPKPPRPTVLTEIGIDVDAFEWAPDGARIAVMARRGPDIEETAQIALVDVATGASRVVAGERSVDVAARWLPDGSFLFVSDADGWFQVVRLSADGHDRIVLTEGEREHGEPGGGPGSAPLPSPDGSRFVHIEVHDGLQDLRVGELAGQHRPETGTRTAAEDATDGLRGLDRQQDQPMGWRLATGRLADRRSMGRGRRRTRVGAAGPVAAPRSGRRSRRCAATAGHRLAPGRAARRAVPESSPHRGACHRHCPRRPRGRGQPVATAHGDRQAWRRARPDDHLPAWRPDRAVVPFVPTVQATARR